MSSRPTWPADHVHPPNSNLQERWSNGNAMSPEYLHIRWSMPGRLQNTEPSKPTVACAGSSAPLVSYAVGLLGYVEAIFACVRRCNNMSS